MSRYRPVLATLGYVLNTATDRVLLVHRTARAGDDQYGMYNGVGGKLEPGEDIVTGFRRELREETGLVADSLELRGTLNWPGFGSDGADWFGCVFLVTAFTGEAPASNAEGTLHWVERARLGELPMQEGDRYFLPLVFDPGVAQFHGVLAYRDGALADHHLEIMRRP